MVTFGAKTRLFLVYAGLAIVILIAYQGGLFNQFVGDDRAIVQDRSIQSPYNLVSRPLMFVQPLLYYLIYSVFGPTPWAFRAVNVLFHLGKVWIVFALALRMYKKVFIAAGGALIVAVHPLLSEPVIWISGGGYVRYSFFLLASFLLYLRFRDTGKQKYYVMSFILYFFSLASAAVAVVYPLMILGYELLLGSVKKNGKYAAGYGALVLLQSIPLAAAVSDRTGAIAANNGPLFQNPFLIIPVAVATYLSLFFWPTWLNHLHWEVLNMPYERFAGYLIVFLLYCASLVVCYRKKYRIELFWLAFFLIALSPTLSPFRYAAIVGERYSYLAVIGLVFAGCAAISRLLPRRAEVLAIIGFSVVGMLLLALTMSRVQDWKDETTFAISLIRVSRAYNGEVVRTADQLARNRRIPEAIELLEKAIEYQPEEDVFYNNIGWYYINQGAYDTALPYVQKALKLNPRNIEALNNLAVLLGSNNQLETALELINRALALDPTNPKLHKTYLYIRDLYSTQAKERLSQ